MTRAAWILVLAVGCTKPNPLDCSDGLCSEADHPFCDVDGSLGGVPNTCVAVTCTANEPAGCRGDVSLVCSASGTNYDLVECERGCDPMYGCRQCTTNEECANPSPVCDATTSACRACKVDDECGSKVCDNGTCLADAGILYIAPGGSDNSSCSLAQPCTMLRAFTLARDAATPPLMRMLPGVYADSITINVASDGPYRIVATGATIAAQSPINVTDGGKLQIRGITLVATDTAVQCDSSSATGTEVNLADSALTSVYVGACAVRLQHCVMDSGSNGSVFLMGQGAQFTADRSYFHAVSSFGIGSFANGIVVAISNSVLDNVNFNFTTSDTSDPGSLIKLSYNTIHTSSLECTTNSGSAHRVRHVENNIILGDNPTSAISGTDCLLAHNIIYPYSAPPQTNIVADPQFVDAANYDYHLKSTSPAIDSGVQGVFSIASPDFDGVMRPQGAGVDIGAFEFEALEASGSL